MGGRPLSGVPGSRPPSGSARSAVTPFDVGYLTPTGDAGLQPDAHTLGVTRFGVGPRTHSDARELLVPLAPIGEDGTVEVWRSAEPVEHGWVGGIGYVHNSDVMLVQLAVDTSRFPGVEQAAFDAYSLILGFLRSRGFPHPIRIWNYVPDINAGGGDAERYKQFSAGRARVLGSLPEYELRLPAASAIGSTGGGLFIHVLAGRHAGEQIESPRQVSAYRYPRRYGSLSPSFSRARLVRWPREWHLYLSGTASVVGHETLHGDDCAAQLQETLRNIECLLGHTSIVRPSLPALGWADLKLLRVYLRDPGDLSLVRAALEAKLRSPAPVVYLHGDICRRNLVLEIDGIFACQRVGA